MMSETVSVFAPVCSSSTISTKRSSPDCVVTIASEYPRHKADSHSLRVPEDCSSINTVIAAINWEYSRSPMAVKEPMSI